ncbi:MAG: hypothetical protein A2622_00980 [Bdellovibrionales bacterium RIFCSPHIGHO2_01_FULL_40_29]|nr:MAG: hypothetical protein A2622_00980 [Bdellovibrionales bacterium RIFCSPHIGHO2_01_FULL_40_29]OFZ32688.1 MAG: hypothetical protein A3D17_05580 [Bdellovibrionales bacterium RIFCSPHIGHO2_02_FULL_40_15]
MLLVGFLIIALTIVATIRFSFYEILFPWAHFFHKICLDRLPENAISLSELSALVCGENFTSAQDSSLYLSTGLIHLFVVSGAHLIFLERILSASVRRIASAPTTWMICSLLGIYCLACDLNAPIVRAFLSLTLAAILQALHLRWPESFKLFIIGMMTLIFNPTWIDSISLQLSWIAALATSMPLTFQSSRTKFSILAMQFIFFVALFPMLLFFQIPNPLTILTNFVFAPVLEVILFPLGLVVWFFPSTYPSFDFSMEFLREILELLEMDLIPQKALDIRWMSYVGWTWILALHFYFHFSEIQSRRRHYD